MPIEDSNGLRDQAEDFLAFFRIHRANELRQLVSQDVLDEFRDDPHGARGRTLELRYLLNYLRMREIEGRVFVYARRPFVEYELGILHARRGEPPELLPGLTYTSEEDAIFGAFVKRLELLGLIDAPDAPDASSALGRRDT